MTRHVVHAASKRKQLRHDVPQVTHGSDPQTRDTHLPARGSCPRGRIPTRRLPQVSYDLAVWAGPAPADDQAARVEYETRADAADGSDEPPSAVIESFLADLVARYPDDEDDGPWAVGPLREDAHGDFAYLTTVYGTESEVLLWIAQTATVHGLVCYDPQVESVLSDS